MAAVNIKDIDAAFQSVAALKNPGTEIWRIENMRAVPVPKSEHGKFYTGDSYIILKITSLKAGGLAYAIHFWLGKETSQDEAGAAAILTIELDAALGGKAIQYREVQGHESNLFLSYFRPCIIPLAGGFATGFRKTEAEEFEKTLYQVKGRRFVKVKKVAFARTSLTHSDIFILDTASKVFQFNGANASIAEKGKAISVTQYLKEKNHPNGCDVAIIEDGKLEDADSGEFWNHFGGYAPIAKKGTGEDEIESKPKPPKLILSFEGSLSEVAEGSLKKIQLKSDNCFLIDCFSEIYVWIGRLSPLDERRFAAKAAEDLIKNEKRPPSTKIIRISERNESQTFKSLFDDWINPSSVSSEGTNTKLKGMLMQAGVVDIKVKQKKDAGVIVEVNYPPITDLSGKIEKWRIDGNEKKSIAAEDMGKFYSGDSYVILHTALRDRKKENMIFYWLGKNTTKEQRASTAAIASKMQETTHNTLILGKVVEGKEPEQFFTLFNCTLLFFKGGQSQTYQESIKSGKNDESFDPAGISLFKTRKLMNGNLLISQLDPLAKSLNSSDCFLLKNASNLFLWTGVSSTEEQKSFVLSAAELISPGSTPKPIVEGKESPSFWMYLGEKAEYPSHPESKDPVKDSRLFTYSNLPGVFKVNEVYYYTQDDLLSEDVMILDAYAEIFIWVGMSANEKEKSEVWDVAQKYISHIVSMENRPSDLPIFKILEGSEPSIFTSHFNAWDVTKSATFMDPYDRKLADLLGLKIQPTDKRKSVSEIGDASNGGGSSASTQRHIAMAKLSGVLDKEKIAKPSLSSAVSFTESTASENSTKSVSSPAPTSSSSSSSQRKAAMASLSGSLKQEKKFSGGSRSTLLAPSKPAISEPADSEKSDVTSEPDSDAKSDVDAKSVTDGEAMEEVDEFFPYERLKKDSDNPAPAIDSTKKETYLSGPDFERLFGMTKPQFVALPKWKRDQKKKSLDLF